MPPRVVQPIMWEPARMRLVQSALAIGTVRPFKALTLTSPTDNCSHIVLADRHVSQITMSTPSEARVSAICSVAGRDPDRLDLRPLA
jgi:hypothetical protein